MARHGGCGDRLSAAGRAAGDGLDGEAARLVLSRRRPALLPGGVSLRADVLGDHEGAERAVRLPRLPAGTSVQLVEPENALVAVGRTQGLAGRAGAGHGVRRDYLCHHPHRSAALVDDRLGGVRRTVPADGAVGARGVVPALLQVRAAEQRLAARTTDQDLASAPERAFAACTSGSSRKSRRRPTPR